MSFTRNGYPSAFATEGDPLRGGFPGDFDPYVHTDRDRMDVDDETGVFSIDVSGTHLISRGKGWAADWSYSIWLGSRSWRLHSLWSKLDGAKNILVRTIRTGF